jgi:hypothetical protein
LAKLATALSNANVSAVKIEHVKVVKHTVNYGEFITNSGRRVTVHPPGTLALLKEQALEAEARESSAG